MSNGPASAERLRFHPLLEASSQTSLYYVELSQRGVKHRLTQSSLLNLFSGQCEHGEQLDQYLYNDVRHQRGKWDRRVDFKAFEEVSEALKQIYKRIVARADANGCLIFPVIGSVKAENRTGYVP